MQTTRQQLHIRMGKHERDMQSHEDPDRILVNRENEAATQEKNRIRKT